jgi:dTDP-glucose 4,6-dehydratase/UDP-glucose 4-epimerase
MDDFKSKKVLITGGAGFIGSNLARRLCNLGAAVTLVDSLIPEYGGNLQNLADFRDKVTLNISDVRDPFSMRQLVDGQDYLFNLAGQTSHMDSMQNPRVDLSINAEAQLSILEACREINPKIRIIFASTRQLYGKPKYLPVDENHPIEPVDVNGINKWAGEWYHILYQRVYGVPCTVLRLTNTYGPGMRVKDARQTFVGIWIKSLIEGSPFKIFGDGEQRRDFNFVEDVVDAMILAAKRPEAVGQIYNLGSKEVVSLNELAEIIVSAAGVGTFQKIPFPAERKAIDIGDYFSNYDLIESELAWKPQVPLAKGLKKTIDYYTQHKKFYW